MVDCTENISKIVLNDGNFNDEKMIELVSDIIDYLIKRTREDKLKWWVSDADTINPNGTYNNTYSTSLESYDNIIRFYHHFKIHLWDEIKINNITYNVSHTPVLKDKLTELSNIVRCEVVNDVYDYCIEHLTFFEKDLNNKKHRK